MQGMQSLYILRIEGPSSASPPQSPSSTQKPVPSMHCGVSDGWELLRHLER